MKQQPADYLSKLFGANVGNVKITFEQPSQCYSGRGYTQGLRVLNLEFTTDDSDLFLSNYKFGSIILTASERYISEVKVQGMCLLGKETNDLLATILN